jgi:hypothetical protein
MSNFIESVWLEPLPHHLPSLILIKSFRTFTSIYKLLLWVRVWRRSTRDNPIISQILVLRHEHNILNLILIKIVILSLSELQFLNLFLLTSPYKLLQIPILLNPVNLQRRYLHITLCLFLSFSLSLLESYRGNSKAHSRVFSEHT